MDGSDEVVGGTTERVVKVRIVCRMPEEQRGDAKDTKSARDVPWQTKVSHLNELVSRTCVANVQLTGTVVEPREDKALVLQSARSGTRKVLILRELGGMACGSVGRRGVET